MSGPEIYKQISKAVDAPQLALEQTKVKSTEDTPWFVEILDK
jgi:hypothetical protein